ncbi:MAG TPA: prepilin-type N-terminal cleavage/methylation domain-containing protein [Vicinamibacteria bacterium]|nr:prepilin-type N-terminal cleavage/methylation domain-containing protein [Vicinamibacteria bacterium]
MMDKGKLRAADGGFTLIEVTVATLILTVGLLALAQMMVLATSSNTLSGRMTSSAALAKEQLERLKAAPFYIDPLLRTRNPMLADGGGLDSPVSGYVQYFDVDGRQATAAGYLYEVRWEITTINTNLPLEMVEIKVVCRPSSERDPFAVIGDAHFTTYRTANVS